MALSDLQPSSGGLLMKAIRAFSLNEDVVRFLDKQADGRGKHRKSRSSFVDEAVRAYWLQDKYEEEHNLKARLEHLLEDYRELKETGHSCLWCRFRSRLKR